MWFPARFYTLGIPTAAQLTLSITHAQMFLKSALVLFYLATGDRPSAAQNLSKRLGRLAIVYSLELSRISLPT